MGLFTPDVASKHRDPEKSQRELWSLAVARVRDGSLPRENSSKLYAGSGQNERCSLCDGTIGVQDVEYEIASPHADDSYFFHLPCYQAWVDACRSGFCATAPQVAQPSPESSLRPTRADIPHGGAR